MCRACCRHAGRLPCAPTGPGPYPPAHHSVVVASQWVSVAPRWPRPPAPARAPVRSCASAREQGDVGSRLSGTAEHGDSGPSVSQACSAPGAAWPCHLALGSAMGQMCCGVRGSAGPAPSSQASPRPPAFFRSSELLLVERAQVTRHQRTQGRHLLLFPDAVAFAKFNCPLPQRPARTQRCSCCWSLTLAFLSPAARGPPQKRRSIPWPFARHRSSASGKCPEVPVAQSLLFGQPLDRLCGAEGSLPQPIQDILGILYREGPTAEGIFRIAASERDRRQLREALDTGGSVELESKPVYLLAALLKDFLRNIPSTLLSVALYERWMQALAKASKQEQMQELKEVAEQLPPSNQLLLKNLLAVLKHISQSSALNKMTSKNLAICIGPSMLGPGQDSTLPLQLQMEMNIKVCGRCHGASRVGHS
ncbi:PREDICTED: uncharacterized protein LOC104578439 [Tinamus guttatus]|uniref:uncharacterized protein LOC104578439 n=1 Tax=Tinamus guttatus TaxID=94827 RepID=UPI00052F1645|nr:PREDICTED: uncharacterized protein LOC104578439 [Tinamus guttatus]